MTKKTKPTQARKQPPHITVHLIAAARPNFMKVAPLYHALQRTDWCQPVLVHTGQHYNANMSAEFLRDLELPEADFHLGVGSGSHAEQTAGVMLAYERVCLQSRPDWVIVVGDVNSTMACSITAKKLCLPLAHLEAGLRSRDLTMPEEINRLVTDSLSDLLWTPSADADENLAREGVSAEKITRVGNIMIDSFVMLREKIDAHQLELPFELPQDYGIVTLHRPANVDQKETLGHLVDALIAIARRLPLVFPIHPRTHARLEVFSFWETLAQAQGIHITEPLSYIPFMKLVQSATLAITDSGGIQEETTYLNIPCLTVRDTTERPITITQGTNRLVKAQELTAQVQCVLEGGWQRGACPELWDGHTAERAAKSLAAHALGRDHSSP